jgi:hypothetical protein
MASNSAQLMAARREPAVDDEQDVRVTFSQAMECRHVFLKFS